MDVRLLEAFRAVVDHRSVTAAAGALGVTQPAVSTQIARLEEAIGFALFERSGGRLKPTPEGMLFYAEATRVLQTMDRRLAKFPEVERVFGKAGRSTSPTDPAPLSMFEINIMLKPQSEWREGMTWDKLIGEMDRAMRFPGLPNIWWMPIQTRTEMLATGIRSSLGIKVFGPELETIESIAVDIERALLDDERTAPYTRSAFSRPMSVTARRASGMDQSPAATQRPRVRASPRRNSRLPRRYSSGRPQASDENSTLVSGASSSDSATMRSLAAPVWWTASPTSTCT